MNSFYHSAYTCDGFRRVRLNSLNPDCFKYILKGKSNAVKGNLLNNLICELDKRGLKFTVSQNYDGRITGIQSDEKGFIICDGTYPFEEEASTYGAIDGIISLEDFQKKEILRSRASDIVSLNQNLFDCERRCQRFLNAAAGISEDKKRLGKDNIDSRKISRYTAKLWAAHGCPPSGKVGVEKKVFFSVPTSAGVSSADSDIYEFCDTAILISDSTGICSDMIVDRLRRYALSSGIDIISCQSFLNFDGNPEHVIMPALRFGVFRESKNINVNLYNIKKVKAKRFMLKEPTENIRVRLQFNQRAYDSLMKEASHAIKSIDRCNSEIDDIYIRATDENALFKFVCGKIFS